MANLFRIKKTPGKKTRTAETKEKEGDNYIKRLVKMIPGEAVVLYISGFGLIPKDQSVAQLVWAAACIIAVIVIRIFGTRDKEEKKTTDWKHVIISSIAFIIWVYNLGGPFTSLNLYIPWIGTLVALFYTFLIPVVYKGPAD